MRFRIRQDRVCAVLCTPSDKQLSAYLADRGHPNESDVSTNFFHILEGRRAVSSLNLGRDTARLSNGFSSFSCHICSMMLSPNCEHLISVAPSIKRAKS